MKKILGIFILILLIGTVLPVSSSMVKFDQRNHLRLNKISNFDNNNKDNDEDFFIDFPVMEDCYDYFDPDEYSPKPIPKATPSQFNWMNKNGKDWTTPAKNQKNCGSCWAFGCLGVFESVIEIEEDCAELNPDLSEQYLLSCLPRSGSCFGGSTKRAFQYIKETTPEGNFCNGIITESCFPYQAIDDDGCDASDCNNDPVLCDEKCEDWEEMLVPLLSYDYWNADGSETDINRIKTQIMEYGPVVAQMGATDNFKIWGTT